MQRLVAAVHRNSFIGRSSIVRWSDKMQSSAGLSVPVEQQLDGGKHAQQLPHKTRPTAATEPRKVLLFCSWMLATDKAIAYYLKLYRENGIAFDNMLVVKTSVLDFLWPPRARQVNQQIHQLLHDTTCQTEQETGQPPAVVVHMSSVGVYSLCYYLKWLMARSSAEYQAFSRLVVGHVFDSLVIGNFDRTARCIATEFAKYKWLAESALKLYLQFTRIYADKTRNFVGELYTIMEKEIFQQTSQTRPTLFLYSRNDSWTDFDEIDRIMAAVQQRDHHQESLMVQCWDESEHVKHIRQHPEDYRRLLINFFHQIEKKVLPQFLRTSCL